MDSAVENFELALMIDPHYGDAIAALITIQLQFAKETLDDQDLEELEELISKFSKLRHDGKYDENLKLEIKNLSKNLKEDPE